MGCCTGALWRIKLPIEADLPPLNEAERASVKGFWESIGNTTRPYEAGEQAFQELVRVHAGVPYLFKRYTVQGVTQGRKALFKGHITDMINSLDALISIIDDHEDFMWVVLRMRDKHRMHPGMQVEYFQTLASFLERGFHRNARLGTYTPSMQAAWKKFLLLIFAGLTKGGVMHTPVDQAAIDAMLPPLSPEPEIPIGENSLVRREKFYTDDDVGEKDYEISPDRLRRMTLKAEEDKLALEELMRKKEKKREKDKKKQAKLEKKRRKEEKKAEERKAEEKKRRKSSKKEKEKKRKKTGEGGSGSFSR